MAQRSTYLNYSINPYIYATPTISNDKKEATLINKMREDSLWT